ncbi:MAG: universal stress protein [Actinomycetota bacterium]
MVTVLAAIHDSAAARPVLTIARQLAQLVGADVRALHVHENGDGETAVALAQSFDIPLRLVAGDPLMAIAEAAGSDEVALVVIGSRGVAAGPRPAGHIALAILDTVGKAVVVVPPDAPGTPIRRVLVPLDGTGASSQAARRLLAPISAADEPEMIVLYVLDPAALPPFSDQPGYYAEALAREFLDRHCPRDARVQIEVRVGNPATVVVDAEHELQADLVAVSWGKDLSPGRARVVRALLSDSIVPVIVIPRSDQPVSDGALAAQSS